MRTRTPGRKLSGHDLVHDIPVRLDTENVRIEVNLTLRRAVGAVKLCGELVSH
jgi:hypothetical protein